MVDFFLSNVRILVVNLIDEIKFFLVVKVESCFNFNRSNIACLFGYRLFLYATKIFNIIKIARQSGQLLCKCIFTLSCF